MAIRALGCAAALLLLLALAATSDAAGERSLLAPSKSKGSSAPKTPMMKVGFLLPFNDPGKVLFSVAQRQGAIQAARDLGFVLQFTSAPSVCGNDTAIQAGANALIKDGAQVIIGHYCSGSTLSALKTTTPAKIPLISATSSAPTLSTQGGAYFLRTSPSDSFQGKTLGTRLASTGLSGKKFTNMLILAGAGDTYGQDLAAVTKDAFTAVAGTKCTIVNLDATTAASVDLSGNPDVVGIFTNSVENSIAALKSLNAQGYKGQVVGGDSMSNPAIAAAPGSEGLVIILPAGGTPKFNDAYMKAWGEMPPNYAAQAYDAMAAAWMGYQASKMASGDKLVAAIKAVKIKDSACAYPGGIAFDKNGDITAGSTGNAYAWRIVKGGMEMPLMM